VTLSQWILMTRYVHMPVRVAGLLLVCDKTDIHAQITCQAQHIASQPISQLLRLYFSQGLHQP
jgi:hypothetical protein